MPTTLRLGGLGQRGLSGGVRLPSVFGSDHTAPEHSESHFFTFIYFSFKSGKCVPCGPQRVRISAANEFFRSRGASSCRFQPYSIPE
jgi:hypothetical protein